MNCLGSFKGLFSFVLPCQNIDLFSSTQNVFPFLIFRSNTFIVALGKEYSGSTLSVSFAQQRSGGGSGAGAGGGPRGRGGRGFGGKTISHNPTMT